MRIKFQIPTLVVASHISLMYMVIDGNYELTRYEHIKYYVGLATIVYASEFCCLARTGLGYTFERQYNDNYILLPLAVLPLAFTSMYVIGFSLVNFITKARIIASCACFIVCYLYHRNYSFIIPVLITYIPLITIILHALTIFGTIIIVRYNNGMYDGVILRNFPMINQLYIMYTDILSQ